MLRVPVCMHNVDEKDIFRPAAWTKKCKLPHLRKLLTAVQLSKFPKSGLIMISMWSLTMLNLWSVCRGKYRFRKFPGQRYRHVKSNGRCLIPMVTWAILTIFRLRPTSCRKIFPGTGFASNTSSRRNPENWSCRYYILSLTGKTWSICNPDQEHLTPLRNFPPPECGKSKKSQDRK